MSFDEKYRLVYVAITRASKDIKIFIPSMNIAKSVDTNKILTNIDEQLKHFF